MVAGTIASEAVDVASTFAVPNVDAFSALDGNGHGTVILAQGSFIQIDVVLVAARGKGPKRLNIFRET